ncbi:hypothetical protein BC829DRAFT_486786 [Chytridium lagenaria]|nr:hypothetical protein BC829DRAFT_486786 [Chytridium lagenaria]
MVAISFITILAGVIASVSAFPSLALDARSAPAVERRAIKPSDFSKWTPTDKNNMSPCPFTNSLANHGFLPRTAMTEKNIRDATFDVFGLDFPLALLFSTQSVGTGYELNGEMVTDLKLLDKAPGFIEHDASLSRSDRALGDHIALNSTLYNEFKSYSSDKKYITVGELARYRAARERDSKARNPSSVSTGNIRIDWMDSVFINERYPVELGWKPRPVTTPRTLALIADLRARSIAFGGVAF